LPANNDPFAGMGGGAGGGAAERATGGGLAALLGVFCATAAAASVPSRPLQSAVLVSASLRGMRPVDGFLLICIAQMADSALLRLPCSPLHVASISGSLLFYYSLGAGARGNDTHIAE